MGQWKPGGTATHAQQSPLDVTHRQAPAAGPDGTPSRPRFSPLCDCRFVIEKRHAVGENGVRTTARRMDGSRRGGVGGESIGPDCGFPGGTRFEHGFAEKWTVF